MKERWLRKSSDEELLERKQEIERNTDWISGSILDGDFDDEIEVIDKIDEELNERSWKRYNESDSDESYGVHREHGWYLPNDD